VWFGVLSGNLKELRRQSKLFEIPKEMAYPTTEPQNETLIQFPVSMII